MYIYIMKKIRKNIDISDKAVKKLKILAAKKDTNVKNLIEHIVEQHTISNQ